MSLSQWLPKWASQHKTIMSDLRFAKFGLYNYAPKTKWLPQWVSQHKTINGIISNLRLQNGYIDIVLNQ